MARRIQGTSSTEVLVAMTLPELCRLCRVHAEWIVELVDEGILEPEGSESTDWRFSTISITRVRTAWRLHRDLGINPAGIAVALNLLEEREELQVRVQRLEHSLDNRILDADS